MVILKYLKRKFTSIFKMYSTGNKAKNSLTYLPIYYRQKINTFAYLHKIKQYAT